jgi:hypothetical protein
VSKACQSAILGRPDLFEKSSIGQFKYGRGLQSNWLIFHKNSISVSGSTDPACSHFFFLSSRFSAAALGAASASKSHRSRLAHQQAGQIGAAP